MYREGEIDAVIFRTFDRLSRKQSHFTLLIEEMENHNVEIHCVKEQLDKSAMGEFTRSPYAFIAEVEREKTRDRTDTGKRQKAKTSIIPTYKPVFGYRFNEDRTAYYINEKEAETIRDMFRRFVAGQSVRSITVDLNEKKIPTPLRKGDMAYNAGNKNFT